MSIVPPPGPATEDRPTTSGGPRGSRAGGGWLDRRTIVIAVGLALVGAVLAGLLAVRVLADDPAPATSADGTQATLVPAGSVDGAAVLAAPLLTAEGTPTTLAETLADADPTGVSDDQLVVVNLWSRTCVPCVKEMPLLEAAHVAHPDVAFVGVNVLDRAEDAGAMAKRTGITYPWVRDPDGSFGNTARASGLPNTLLLTAGGTVLASKVGAFADHAAFLAWLDEHRAPA